MSKQGCTHVQPFCFECVSKDMNMHENLLIY